jgi:putative membrane protein
MTQMTQMEPIASLERRLHPATLVFDLIGSARAFALPALAIAFGVSRSEGPAGFAWEMWLPLLLVPALAVSVVRYLTFRLRFGADELVIRSGLLFRNQRHIPFSRIQNVDAVENLLHRLLGVVEVRIQTGGGKEEEARLSVLSRSALDDIRRHVFSETDDETRNAPVDLTAEARSAKAVGAPASTLIHLPFRELLLYGLLENKGMVLIGAGFGVLWEMGLIEPVSDRFFETAGFGRGLARDFLLAVFDDGPLPVGRMVMASMAFVVFLLGVRVLSMVWAVLRLYDFRLTRVQEDLRSEYGLLTKVTATVPMRRVQAIIISEPLLFRWCSRASVRVETAGGSGGGRESHAREWLAPIVRREHVSRLVSEVVPAFDLDAVDWQPVHPRAFRRAVKPGLAVIGLIGLVSVPWATVTSTVLLATVALWSVASTMKYVQHLGWAETDEVVLMKSGWLWRQVTLARVNKIQAVMLRESPFDRRSAMARVRVDTAGAGELSNRVDVPYLDRSVARALAARLSAAAAGTEFRW